jgi:polyphosphate kinase 2 (PPK2 family)
MPSNEDKGPRGKAAVQAAPGAPAAGAVVPALNSLTAAGGGQLAAANMSQKLSASDYKKQIPDLQVRLLKCEFDMYRHQVPVLCVMEGWDAAGKGGAIKRIAAPLDPRGFSVVSFAAPHDEEKAHHYLWRFWRNLPRAGHLTIFDRSYYGRVLVERVEGFAKEKDWRRAYQEISEFEAQQVSFGMVIVKFWMHIMPGEQLERFRGRELDPYRSYKLTKEDWRNRQKWDEYSAAVEEMFTRTSTSAAPWTIVPAEDKRFARVTVLRTLAESIERRLDGG